MGSSELSRKTKRSGTHDREINRREMTAARLQPHGLVGVPPGATDRSGLVAFAAKAGWQGRKFIDRTNQNFESHNSQNAEIEQNVRK
jgi:hypothetical protein